MELKDIEKLAELAKLQLNDSEKESLQKDLESILDYIKQIEEVKVEEGEIKYSPQNVWREDDTERKECEQNDFISSQFPDSQDGFVKVKKIL